MFCADSDAICNCADGAVQAAAKAADAAKDVKNAVQPGRSQVGEVRRDSHPTVLWVLVKMQQAGTVAGAHVVHRVSIAAT